MAQQPSAIQSYLQPLGIGNVVSIALIVYRSRFKEYYVLALQAMLWLFVPVYGWAKSCAISALIGRLTFQDLIQQPESVSAARKHVNRQMWNFLACAILVVIAIAFMVVPFIISLFVVGLFASLLIAAARNNWVLIVAISFLMLLVFAMIFSVFFWLTLRVSLAEIPLAVEKKVDPIRGLSRNWTLSQRSFWRFVGIWSTAVLITFPLQALVQVASSAAQFLPNVITDTSSEYFIVGLLLSWIVSFVGGAFLLPFWQSLKAVVYYDMRCRREGFGLKFREPHQALIDQESI
jgi:hypothetical protein